MKRKPANRNKSPARKPSSAALAAIAAMLALCVCAGGFLLFTSGAVKLPNSAGQAAGPPATAAGNSAPAEPSVPDINDQYITIVGDSIVVGATPELKKRLANVSINAKVGRTMPTGYDILSSREKDGTLEDADVIVVSLANNISGNSIAKAKDIIALVQPGQRLVFVTGHGLSSMKPLNDFLRTLPDDYDWITVADWDSAISLDTEWLASDGIHAANNKANVLYANIVTDAIQLALAKPAAPLSQATGNTG